MSSLEFHPELLSFSFPEPPPKVNRTGGDFITLGGKPLILLFTISNCSHCEWEKPVFREAMAGFSGSIVVKEISADVAPFEYQPLFINHSMSSLVPLILFAGVYSKSGSNEQSGVCDCISRPEEKERLQAAVCLLFPDGELPQPCLQ